MNAYLRVMEEITHKVYFVVESCFIWQFVMCCMVAHSSDWCALQEALYKCIDTIQYSIHLRSFEIRWHTASENKQLDNWIVPYTTLAQHNSPSYHQYNRLEMWSHSRVYIHLRGITGRPQSVWKEELAFIQNPGIEISVIFFWEFEVMGPRSKIILNSLDGRKEAKQYVIVTGDNSTP